MNRLSILICSLEKRKEQLERLLESIEQQAGFKGVEQNKKSLLFKLRRIDYGYFDVIILTDNKQATVGMKRNKLVRLATYEYICFIDDDDRVNDDYVKLLKNAINTKIDGSDYDSVVFKVLYNPVNGKPKEAIYSAGYYDFTYQDHFKRKTNHLMVVKRAIALKATFPNTSFGEDSNYAKQIARHIKNEAVIDKVLYYYDFDIRKSETQGRNKR